MRFSNANLMAIAGCILGIAASAGAAEKIYWTASGTIYRANLDGTEVEELFAPNAGRIALDAARGKIYWTHWSDAIRRANLDGSDVEDVVTELRNLRGLAVDVEAAKIYWADSFTDKIQRANLDGSRVEDLVTVGLCQPTGIVLDTVAGKMYWISGLSNPKIQRANLDGSDVEDLVIAELGDLDVKDPVYLALDTERGKMYISCTTRSPPGHILSANLDGSGFENLQIIGLVNPYGVGVDRLGRIYYADATLSEIRRANTTASHTLISMPWGSDLQSVVLDLLRDCNGNGMSDEEDITGNTSTDCSGNYVPDECEPDCNGNGVADTCDIAGATSDDCNSNFIPDECEPDCNGNGVADSCDITEQTSEDCTNNGTPDECEPDCNDNGIADTCDILVGTSSDCNTNELIDACEITAGTSADANGNGVPDVCDTKVYWTDQHLDKICRANRDGSGPEDLVTVGLGQPKGIAVDVVGGKMYWGDQSTDKIQRANLDGSNVEDLVMVEGFGYGGMALDLARRKMYWKGGTTIQRANLDGSGVEDLVVTSAKGITLDVVNGKMYWSGYDIKRANLDGSDVETLPIQARPYDMALDLVKGQIYWTSYYMVQRANLDGTCIEDLVVGLSQALDIAVDLEEEKVYWVDAEFGVVQRANLDGSDVQIVGSSVQPWALALDLRPPDCNNNGVPDYEDIISGTSDDCTGNGVPDECEPDCNNNGVADSCDTAGGTSEDCNGRGFGVPDECEVAAGTSEDCNSNGVPDECEGGCNDNEIPDECEPDEDCNGNGIRDICDIGGGTSLDCNLNDVPDLCDVAGGTSGDCNSNGVPDECIDDESDCNRNLIPDLCDIAEGTSTDYNENDVPDECELCRDAFDCFDGNPCTDELCTENDVCERSDVTPCFDGATIAWKAVGVNGMPIAPASDVTVLTGDQVTTEFTIEGWLAEVLLRCYVAIDPSGYTSGSGGSLEPLEDPSPEAGLFVDQGRSDWLFHGFSTGAAYCWTPDSLDWSSRSEVHSSECGAEDMREPRYLATLILNVSHDAAGTFVVDIKYGGSGSVVSACDRSAILPLRSVPLTINVEPDCNDNGSYDGEDVAEGTSKDDNANGIPDECEALAVSVAGCRYLAVLGPTGFEPLALRVTSPEYPCLSKYVQANGRLGNEPFFQMPHFGDAVLAHGADIVPGTAYAIQAEFADGTLSGTATATTARWGDTVGRFTGDVWTSPDGEVRILDIVAILEKFRDLPSAPPLERVDLQPEAPDGIIDILDATYAVDAFRGFPYPFAGPGECP